MKELVIKNLKIEYGKNTIINNLNLHVKKDELLVILGPSGCGKSTLLSGVSGLLKPTNGYISFGERIFFDSEKKINMITEKREIGFVFQDYSLWPHMTVKDNIIYPLKLKKIEKTKINLILDDILKDIELSDKKDVYPNNLSGGEKQRIAIARSLVMNPSFMCLDEPLSNIDPILKMRLLKLIKKIQIEYKIPMIYVTHDQHEAFEIADRILIMDKGEIIQSGLPEEIYNEPNSAFVAKFIGRSNIVSENVFGRKKNCKRLVIRPEDIEISEKGKYVGFVKKKIFRGSFVEMHIKYNRETLIIHVNNDKHFVGEEIRFNINKSHVI